MKWQPIETISPTIEPPTFVIGAERKPDGTYAIGEVHWTSDGWYWAQTDPTDNWGRRVDVSMWMPLPVPPDDSTTEPTK